jgi:hypothetical protein
MNSLSHKGLVVTAMKHPATGHRAFPKGIYYGTVEGRDCTAPHGDADRAIQDAISKIDDGGLAASLMTRIRCMEGWVTSGCEKPNTQDQIAKDRALLAKVLPLVEGDWFLANEAKAMADASLADHDALRAKFAVLA